MKPILFLVFLAFLPITFSQIEMKSHIQDFYNDLNKGDKEKVRSYFHNNAVIEHVENEKELSFTLDGFLGICDKFLSGKFQEKILKIDENEFVYGFQSVDVYFEFLIDGKKIHCGMDHIVFSLKNNEFKIQRIFSVDSPCEFIETLLEKDKVLKFEEKDTIKLNYLLDNWHEDASDANIEKYFKLMSDDFVFLGTDPQERWTKKEFYKFCEPYFEAGKTWHFTSNWRNWYFSEDGKTAWFEESLTTQMDECRGSGVFVYENDEWKISHYNLTVLIENEKMKKFLKLRSK